MPAAFNEELGESNLSRLAATSASDTTRDVIGHTRANWILLKDEGNYGTEPAREFKGKGKSGRIISPDDADLEETTVFLRQRIRALAKDQFTTYSGSYKDWTSKRVAETTLQFQAPESKWKLLRTTDAFKAILEKAVQDVNGTWIRDRDLSDLIKGVISQPVRPSSDDLVDGQSAADLESLLLREMADQAEEVKEDAVSDPEHASDEDSKRRAVGSGRAPRRPKPGEMPVPEPQILTEEDRRPYDRPQGPRQSQRSQDQVHAEVISAQRARPTVSITDDQPYHSGFNGCVEIDFISLQIQATKRLTMMGRSRRTSVLFHPME